MLKTIRRRQVLLLALAQALFQTCSAIVMTVGVLAATHMSGSPQWATLPVATTFLGAAILAFPASRWMARVGRRKGFVCGSLLGVAGGLVSALGIVKASLTTLAIGTFLIGNYEAFATHYRFAAYEMADGASRPRAIALVLGGGVAAAFSGPLLARLGASLLHPQYLGSFLILAVACLAGTVCLLGLRIPPKDTLESFRSTKRKLRQVITQPAYLVALFGAATAFGVMTLTMAATPLAMAHYHLELHTSASAIQLHILSMFLPSFFTGSLIVRFGPLRIMLIGTLLLAGHVIMTMMGTGFGWFAGALMLLGVGWNFLYVGGTALLSCTYMAEDSARAQAFNDTTIFLVNLVCSLGAGGLLHSLGWQRMNLSLLPWIAIAMSSIVFLELKDRGIWRAISLRSQAHVAR